MKTLGSIRRTGITFLAFLLGLAIYAPSTQATSNPLMTGQRINFDSVQMVNVQNGWALDQAGNVLYTMDGGVIWRKVNQDPIKISAKNFLYDYFLNKSTAWLMVEGASGEVRLFQTKDRGIHWIKSHAFLLKYPGGGIQIDFVNKQVGYMENYQPGMGPFQAVLYRTTDGGMHWSVIADTNSLVTDRYTLFSKVNHHVPFGGSIHFYSQYGGWLSGGPRGIPSHSGVAWLYKTMDGGKDWRLVTLPVPTAFQKEHVEIQKHILFNSRLSIFLVNYWSNQLSVNRIYRYENQHWTTYKTPAGSINQLVFTSPKIGWILMHDGQLYKTVNEGRHWENIRSNTSLRSAFDLQFVNSKTGWMILGTHLWKTSDGGNSWKEFGYSPYNFSSA